VDAWKLIDIVLGLFVLGVAIPRAVTTLTAWQGAAFVLLIFSGGVILYSVWIILAALSFWFVRVENILEIFRSMYEAGRWPLSLYPGWLRFALTFIIPVAFATTIPVEALTGRADPISVAGAAGLAVGLLLAARIVWRIGIRRYSGASA
jgi:ABC-2 type transport system permease protein